MFSISSRRNIEVRGNFMDSFEDAKGQPDRADKAWLELEKKKLQKNIPVHISSKLDEHIRTPLVLSIHTYLTAGKTDKAWKAFESAARRPTENSIPPAIVQNLFATLRYGVSARHSHELQKSETFRKRYEHRLETLLSHTQKTNYMWSSHDFAIIIDLFGKIDRADRAEVLFRNRSLYCREPMTTLTYNKLMAAYLRKFRYLDGLYRRRYLSKIETLFFDMEKNGLQPDLPTYNLMLAARVKASDLSGAEKFYQRMISTAKLSPDRMTYNIFLNGFLKDCQTQSDNNVANEWMNRMVDAGIVPNLRTFNNVLDGIADQVVRYARLEAYEDMHRALDSVKDIYQVLVRLSHKPNIFTINALLKSYSAANDDDQVKKMVDMLAIEKQGKCGCDCSCAAKKEPNPIRVKKVMPDSYTFNTLINYYLKKQDVNEAFRTYDTMLRMDISPGTVTYGSFINYYIKQGNIDEALKYYDTMQRKQIPNSTTIYNMLLHCYLERPEYSTALEPRLRLMLAGDIQEDAVSYNSRMSALNLRSDPDTSVSQFTELFDHMTMKEIDANQRTYNLAMAIHGAQSQSRRTIREDTITSIFNTMSSAELKPDVITYALAIRSAVYSKNMAAAERTFKNMVKAGVRPNTYVFSHLVYGYAQMGNLDKAENILERMSSAPFNVQPNVIAFAPLIKGYADASEYDKAYKTFRKMVDKGVSADMQTYTILANMLLESPVSENEMRAITLLDGLKDSEGARLDQAALTVLIEAHGLAGKTRLENAERLPSGSSYEQDIALRDSHAASALKTYNDILETGKKPDAIAITTLLTSFARMKKPDAAWKFWKELDTVPLSPVHYNALLMGLAPDKSWYPVARSVFENMIGRRLTSDASETPVTDPKVMPDVVTFDVMVLGALDFDDYESIRSMWLLPYRPSVPRETYTQHESAHRPLLVRTYYAAMNAMLYCEDMENAQKVYQEFRLIRNIPSSATLYVHRIEEIAAQLELRVE
ncbi:hypothetical protein DFQ28_005894 [Apophysomyces sp. BC1034]|nr:hypothetical protein DFQ30_003458 [Apophysomyces sp. BC1015]KAG0180329.1 hypothetical protein DFQ29_000855 [Apophysomyces sp. BC1021]KAG0187751.1 hypothetical protein DFQ28_005894 [Apophysomyces sp. BC1034]